MDRTELAELDEFQRSQQEAKYNRDTATHCGGGEQTSWPKTLGESLFFDVPHIKGVVETAPAPMAWQGIESPRLISNLRDFPIRENRCRLVLAI